MSESQFQMWRCVIAIAHTDGQLQQAEREYLGKVFASLERVHGLTPAQQKSIADDMAHAKQVTDILPLVTEPQYRGLLVHFGETLAWADNELSLGEEDILKKLHAGQMAAVDLNQLRADVKRHMVADTAAHDKEMQALRNGTKSPILRALDRVAGKLGFDIFS